MKKLSVFILCFIIFIENALFSSAYSYTSDLTNTQTYANIHGIIIAVGLGLTIITSFVVFKITKSKNVLPIFTVIGLAVVALITTSIIEFSTLGNTVSVLSYIVMIIFFSACVINIIMYAVSDSEKIDFVLTSTKILTSLLVVFALSTAVLGLMLHQSKIETAASEAKNNTYMIEATEAKNKLESANKTIRKLEIEQDDYISKISFFENNIVFCDDESNYYHKYECENWNRNSFYAYNTENAIYQGYKPCPECCN